VRVLKVQGFVQTTRSLGGGGRIEVSSKKNVLEVGIL
jgi:hypothetical protein